MTDPITRMFDEAFALDLTPTAPKVFVLIIEHRHGSDATVYASRDGAQAGVEEYCREWWLAEVAERYVKGEETETYALKPPENLDQLVEKYFDAVDDECYSIEECEVRP